MNFDDDYSRIVRNQRNVVFKSSLDVDRPAVNREPEIVVEFIVGPLRSCLPGLRRFHRHQPRIRASGGRSRAA